jgi:hypothetical protein
MMALLVPLMKDTLHLPFNFSSKPGSSARILIASDTIRVLCDEERTGSCPSTLLISRRIEKKLRAEDVFEIAVDAINRNVTISINDDPVFERRVKDPGRVL